MSCRVVITKPAMDDATSNHDWWAANRSSEQAARWLKGIYAAILGLAASSATHPMATERDLREIGIQQAAFGLGRRPSHRILFKVQDERIIVYRVRAFRQDAIGPGDLSEGG